MPVPRANAEMEMKIIISSGAAVYDRRRVARKRSAVTDRRSRRSRTRLGEKAFTLIELLVVIAIIAILMGLAFPVFQSVQTSAKKTQAKNDLVQIVTAVNAFYTEYGRYPLATGADDTIYGTAASPNNTLFDVLRAKNATENSRRIIFISPPDVKDPANPRSGVATAASNLGQYFDPWGTAYRVKLDGNYNDQIDINPYLSAGSSPLQAGVIAWSFGKDLASQSEAASPVDKNTGTNKDDVISWQ